MSGSLLDQLKRSAEALGCDPLWLKNGEQPEFQSVEHGTSGPVVLLLHGLFGAMSNWDSILPLMSKYARVINLSFPLLTAHRSEVKVKSLALYTEYFIRSRNLGKVVLCGNSLGGHVALRLALASPQLIDKMVLTATSGLYEHAPSILPVRPNAKFIREHMGKVFFQRKFVTDAAIDEILEILKSRKNHLNLIHAARSAKRDNLQALLPTINIRTLLLWGADDEVTPMDVANEFKRLLPDSTLITHKNCGHAPMIEYPEWFAAEVEKFLVTK